MKLAVFNVGPENNLYMGPHTYADVLFPLVDELQKRGVSVSWVGISLNNRQDNTTLKDIGVKFNMYDVLGFNIKVDKKLKRSWDLLDASEFDALLCQPRPLTNKIENQILYTLINKFLDAGKKVFVWEQDMFTDEFTDKMREGVIFLHPAIKQTGRFKREIYFPFFTHSKKKYETPERSVDFLFMGNIYGRQPQATKFFGPLNDAPFGKLVFGSWLQDEERRKFSSQFDKFIFAGSTEHWAAMPVMRRAKATLHIVPDFAKERGLMTARVFTSQMAGCLCFCDAEIFGAEKFFPPELIVKDGNEIIERWDAVQKDRENLLWKRKVLLDEHTVEKRAEQFLTLLNE